MKEYKLNMKKNMNRAVGKIQVGIQRGKNILIRSVLKKEPGIDGILVTVGLCIIALLLCVVMKDSLTGFIQTIVDAMKNKATTILNGV